MYAILDSLCMNAKDCGNFLSLTGPNAKNGSMEIVRYASQSNQNQNGYGDGVISKKLNISSSKLGDGKILALRTSAMYN